MVPADADIDHRGRDPAQRARGRRAIRRVPGHLRPAAPALDHRRQGHHPPQERDLPGHLRRPRRRLDPGRRCPKEGAHLQPDQGRGAVGHGRPPAELGRRAGFNCNISIDKRSTARSSRPRSSSWARSTSIKHVFVVDADVDVYDEQAGAVGDRDPRPGRPGRRHDQERQGQHARPVADGPDHDHQDDHRRHEAGAAAVLASGSSCPRRRRTGCRSPTSCARPGSRPPAAGPATPTAEA